MGRPATLSRFGLFNLAVVYVVWGGTYLAKRIAVRSEGGFPPFHLALLRVVAASLVLAGIAGVFRNR